MKWLSRQLRKDMWTPEIAGVGLGIVYILSLLLAKKLPGASGTVFNISAIVGKPLTAHDPTNTFFSQMFQPITDGLNWQFYMLVGLFLGQKLDLPAAIGIAMILAGVLVINLFSSAAAH